MKQHEILSRFFKTKGAICFAIRLNTDDKLNVLGIHYILVPDAKKLPKNWVSRTLHYLDKQQLSKIEVLSQGQLGAPYMPASDSCTILDTIVPDSMDYEIHSAVQHVKAFVGGSINEFVKDKLRYNDVELCKSLAAEQVDGTAMGIYNIEFKGQGLIIGDQTGIGKGRMAAAFIRYARNRGLKPIFITEKANLFSDIYRDLKAIGSASLVPFIVNGNESKTKVKDEDGNVVYEPDNAQTQDAIFKSLKVPDTYDYVMATYSQFASEKVTIKQSFLSSIAQGNVLILDESHNAGGNLETSATARFFFNIVKEAKGVIFLSATFAKRPDNMPLYAAKTAISEANMTNDQLIQAIEKGGVALQEILSANLVAEGQMIRRERSFEGVEVNYITLDANGARDYGVPDKEQEHKAVADNITDILRDIISFQGDYINPVIGKMDDVAKAENKEIVERGGTAKLGVDSPPYFSKVFNVINQMLFSIKAEAVADRAIQRLKEGKKPVIAFSSTMGAFLEQMENERGLPVSEGDTINGDFSEVLQRGLEGTLRYSEHNHKGETIKHEFKLSELSLEAQRKYAEILTKINSVVTGITISPIDAIKQRIEKAGYSVSEVTGRKLEVQFKPNSTMGVVLTRKKENVNDAFRKFNNNQADCLLINQSGSTGASAHAIVTDRVPLEKIKQRAMIVLQAELDINREVQKRGRINRTGQVYKPIYDYVTSAIPAEKRLMMMLQKKLKSLDANTTSNQKQSRTLLQSEDFLNKYGDEKVVEYLKDNPEINELLDDPCNMGDSEKGMPEDAALKVSGRVAVLSTRMQQAFYAEMIERYNNYVEYLIQTGDYDLEVETMNLEAQTIENKPIIIGKGGESLFAGNTYLEKCEVNVLKKPFSKTELTNILTESLEGKGAKDIQNEMVSSHHDVVENRLIEDTKRMEEKYQELIGNIKNEKKYKSLSNAASEYFSQRLEELKKAGDDAINMLRTKSRNEENYIQNFFRFFHIGRGVNFPMPSWDNEKNNIKAIFLGFRVNDKKPNPYAPSAVTCRFALSDSNKYFELVLSGKQGEKVQQVIGASQGMRPYEVAAIVDQWDELTKLNNVNRKVRYIVTGNILQAFSKVKGKLVSYTTKEGGVKKGILMPDNWQPKDDGMKGKINVPIVRALKIIKGLSDGTLVETSNGVSIMRTNKGYKILTAGLSIQRYAFIIKNIDILALIGTKDGFEKVSSSWVANIEFDKIARMVELLQETGASVEIPSGMMDQIEIPEDKPIQQDTERKRRLRIAKVKAQTKMKLLELLKV